MNRTLLSWLTVLVMLIVVLTPTHAQEPLHQDSATITGPLVRLVSGSVEYQHEYLFSCPATASILAFSEEEARKQLCTEWTREAWDWEQERKREALDGVESDGVHSDIVSGPLGDPALDHSGEWKPKDDESYNSTTLQPGPSTILTSPQPLNPYGSPTLLKWNFAVGKEQCDTEIRFDGGGSKRISDLFPLECATVVRPLIAGQVYSDGFYSCVSGICTRIGGGGIDNVAQVYSYNPSSTTAIPPAPSLRVTLARYKLVKSGLLKSKPCDPPTPKDSNVSCAEDSPMWSLDCGEGSGTLLEVLPDVGTPFFDYGKARERGDKFWCVSVSE